MPDTPDRPPQFTGIALADGRHRLLCPTDTEAAAVISQLAQVMQLSYRQAGEKIFVTVRHTEKKPVVLSEDPATTVCILPPGQDDTMRAVQMMTLGKTLVLRCLQDGGLLIHGALVERDGYGIILAGPGTVGKSTASRRIPLPWRAVSDDATLVVRDTNGRYRAHPWPTWSRFLDGGPGGSWDVQKAVPVKGIFCLAQAAEDRVERVGRGQAVSLLGEAVGQISAFMVPGLSPEELRVLRLEQFNNLCLMARVVPVHVLHISLTGHFWREIERAL